MKLGRCAVKALVYIYISTTLVVKYCTFTTICDIIHYYIWLWSTLFPLKFFDGAVALPSKQTVCRNNMHPSIATARCLVPSLTPTNTLHYRRHRCEAQIHALPLLYLWPVLLNRRWEFVQMTFQDGIQHWNLSVRSKLCRHELLSGLCVSWFFFFFCLLPGFSFLCIKQWRCSVCAFITCIPCVCICFIKQWSFRWFSNHLRSIDRCLACAFKCFCALFACRKLYVRVTVALQDVCLRVLPDEGDASELPSAHTCLRLNGKRK